MKIRIDDFKVLYQFETLFSKDLFRKSVRNYRNLYGRDNLNEELALIQKGISYFSKFYEANQIELDQTNKDEIISKEVEFYDNEIKLVHKKIEEIEKEISDLSAKAFKIEYSEDPDYEDLILKKTSLIGDCTTLKLEQNKMRFKKRKYTSLYSKTSSFSEINNSYSILKFLIENELEEPKILFPDKFSDESLEIINSIFEPPLNKNSARKFFNKIHSSGVEIKYKDRKKTKACNVIYQLSKTIVDQEIKSLWEHDILNYFGIDKDLFDKKKTYSKLNSLTTI